MKKILLYTLVISSVLISCQKKLDEININPKRPTSATPESLFANAAKDLHSQITSISSNRNNFLLWSQYLTCVLYTDEANYDLRTRNISRNEWNIIYRDVLKDFSEASTYTEAEIWASESDIAAQKNRLAMIEIYTVYCYNRLTTIFGDIPYTDALSTNLPSYDDAATIYADLDKRLVAAISTITVTESSFPAGFDNLFSGDMGMWVKFANGLRLRMAITTADVNPTGGQTVFNAVKDKVFAIDESAQFDFLSGLPNTNPMWETLTGRDDFVACETIVDTMTALNDPRLLKYFQVGPGTSVIGGVYGAVNPYQNFSHLNDYFLNQTQPNVIMDGVEMAFYFAEAAERKWGGDSKINYDAAVTQSIVNWGGTPAEALTYLTQPSVAYSIAGGLNQVGYQAWLAYFNRGMLSWTLYRRLDIKGNNGVNSDDLMNKADLTSESVPKRYTYSIDEQTLNRTNYDAASSAIGGDKKDTRLWWDRDTK